MSQNLKKSRDSEHIPFGGIRGNPLCILCMHY